MSPVASISVYKHHQSTMSNSIRSSDLALKLADIHKYEDDIYYSPRYADDHHEYRHVALPKQLAKYVPQGRLMTEAEWRGLGVKQSQGWVHYMIHNPEPHILLFRRDKDPIPATQTVAPSNTVTNSTKENKINGQQQANAAGGRVGGMVA
ncbi:hypothetical protein SeMB42_g01798 [Synchytrium endobioticum]|uniref:Cyclin-dependent kinases regulatory subunit n=1 Tax=Synchytrium endobioticum TaxID=286115 RepID=A0A507DJQ6_9FUNG|nr:hypothetical protein SeLEV6574_g02914 [Synchytrium endobioticum]TPX51892.1 hypothetical protein SeMB42_g01798 [Synchytrium endobioticum]